MKTACITGASSGIGKALAQLLAAEGYTITAIARHEEPLKELIKEIGPQHRYMAVDLQTKEGKEKVQHDIFTNKYQLLINNAGFGIYGPFESLPVEKQHEMIAVNIQAVVDLSYTFLHTAQKGDALVNIGSIAGSLSYPVSPVYGATKAFVISFSESLWYTQKKRGIYVLCVNPGATDTAFHQKAGAVTYASPGLLVQSPKSVAKETLAALKKRKQPVVVCGFRNKCIIFAKRFLPTAMRIRFVGRYNAQNPNALPRHIHA